MVNSSDHNLSRLDALEKRRKKIGSLGALDFLIAYEETRASPNRIEILQKEAHTSEQARRISVRLEKLRKSKNNHKKPKKNKNKIDGLRTKLLSLGFTEEPLAELEVIARTSINKVERARAAQVIGLWYLRVNTTESCRKALDYFDLAKENASEHMQRQIELAQLFCCKCLKDMSLAEEIFSTLEREDALTPDLVLGYTNFKETEEERLDLMNRALAMYGIPKLSLLSQLPGQNLPAYDRLQAADPVRAVASGPKVTVLVAAYNAADTLPTCLRSLQQQSWQNLEVIVLDDHSPTLETFQVAQEFSRKDSRFKAVRMPKNAGAYVARNYGLRIATGDFVTLHDADDWSHPLKIEVQARHLVQNKDIIANLGEQARVDKALFATRWTGYGHCILVNTSSFMFRRCPVLRTIGYWDRVRMSADSEYIDRIRKKYGRAAVIQLKGALYSFQRDSETSIIADAVFGISQAPHGIRKIYKDIHRISHNDGHLMYAENMSSRPFPVPYGMIASKKELSVRRHYDVIIASDFRMAGGSVASCIQEIICQKRAGLKTAVLPMFRYDFDWGYNSILPEVWRHIDGEKMDVLAFGDKVSCDVLIVRYPPVLECMNRYMPDVHAKNIKIIVNQTPMSSYDNEGVVRYHLDKCSQTIRKYFGKTGDWHPIGSQVREALIKHHSKDLELINFSDHNWVNIIDISEWDRGRRRRRSGGRLRLGRHARDDIRKWPENPKELLEIYPDDPILEVHILGGSKALNSILGDIPNNWTVHDFGAIDPKDFLRDIDVFVYFTSTGLVEAFGRVILEAMAAGVPVVLPQHYEPLFKQAALYATPQTAVAIAKDLHSNQAKYDEQVRIAQAYVQEHFSFETHLRRLKDLGVQIRHRHLEVC